MKTEFCEKWLVLDRRPLDPYSRARALRLHSARRPYTALVFLEEQDQYPAFAVSVANEWVSVAFLDRSGVQFLHYDFKEVSLGRLFLKGETSWRHIQRDGARDRVTRLVNYGVNGGASILEYDLSNTTLFEKDIECDVSSNWIDYPEFSAYEEVCVKDRVRVEI